MLPRDTYKKCGFLVTHTQQMQGHCADLSATPAAKRGSPSVDLSVCLSVYLCACACACVFVSVSVSVWRVSKRVLCVC